MRKNSLLFSLITLIALSFSTNVNAGNRAGAFTITSGGGYYFFDNDRHIDNHGLLTISGGYNFTKNWGIEGLYSYLRSHRSDVPGRRVSINLFLIDGVYHFTFHDRFQPFAMLGFGLTNTSPNGSLAIAPSGDETHLQTNLNAAMGTQYFLSDSIALRGEGRYLFGTVEHHNDFIINFGISFLFGGHKDTANQVTLYFPINSERLADKEKNKLNEFVSNLHTSPEKNVQIDGYTSSTGPERFNRTLSRKRADNVAHYLVRQGVEQKRLSVKAHGGQNPVATNKTEKGRARNRRAEAKIIHAS